MKYPIDRTAYLLVDPYNDFLSEGGKVYPFIEPIARKVGVLDNLRALDRAIRARGIPVVIVPHRRWEPGDYENWDHPNLNRRDPRRPVGNDGGNQAARSLARRRRGTDGDARSSCKAGFSSVNGHSGWSGERPSTAPVCREQQKGP